MLDSKLAGIITLLAELAVAEFLDSTYAPRAASGDEKSNGIGK